ncbi:hypothetical protein YK56LOC_71080 [Caballeronia sp. HLA56]
MAVRRDGIVITALPETTHEGQFEEIGSLSSLVTAAYGEMTVNDKRPIALDIAADPAPLACIFQETTGVIRFRCCATDCS